MSADVGTPGAEPLPGPGGPGAPAAPPPSAERSAAAPVHSEARLFSILGQYAVMQVVLAFTGLIRNKVVAFRLGPAAFGEISQLAAVMGVAATLVSFGMAVSLSRNAARSRTLEERQEHLANANGIVLALSVVALAVTLVMLASGQLLRLAGLGQYPAMTAAAALFLAAIPLQGLQTNYLALLEGILDVKGLAIGRSVAVLIATIVAVPIVWVFGLVGAAVQYLLLTLFVTVMLGRRCHTIGYAPLRVRLEREHLLLLASFGIVSMVSGFAQGFADTAVRTSLIEKAGVTANGLLQAPFMLAVVLKGVVLASIGSISLATIAPQTDPREVSAAVDRLLNVVIPVGASALGLLGLLGVPAMLVLYSKAFVAGARFFPYVLDADLLLVFVWVIGTPLLARGDRILWLALDLVHYAARWAAAVLLLPSLGSKAVVVGYLLAVALHVALNLCVYRLRYRLELPARHLARLLVGLALVALASVAGAAPGASLPATGAVALAWIVYTVHHARRSGILPLLQQRLQRR